jgi:hypothetical protein
MRQNVCKSGLAAKGDTILVWINEGDFLHAQLVGGSVEYGDGVAVTRPDAPQTASQDGMLLGRCQRLGHCGYLDCMCDMEPSMKNGRTPFDPKAFADFRRSIHSGEFVGIPMDVGAELTQKQALTLAIHHIEHMSAWIAKQNAGYSFESLGEDMPGIKAALALTRPELRTGSAEQSSHHQASQEK